MKEQFELYLEGVRKVYPDIRAEQEKTDPIHMEEIEKNMGLRFPEELKLWFQLIGKAEYGINGFLAGLEVYDIDGMFEEWKSWREFDDNASLNDEKLFSSQPSGAVKRRYTDPGWIPLAHDYASNYIGVDLDPGENGVEGQIINFGRDEDDKTVFADSLKAFLGLLTQYQSELVMEGGADEDARAFYANEEGIHTIDWLKAKTDSGC